MIGDAETGRGYAEKGLRIHCDVGAESHLSLSKLRLGQILMESGDSESARNLAEEALNLSRKYNEKHNEGLSLLLLGMVLAKTESRDIHKAEVCIRKGMAVLNELRSKPYVALGYLYLGRLYRDAGQEGKALEKLEKAEEMCRDMRMNYWLNKTREILEVL